MNKLQRNSVICWGIIGAASTSIMLMGAAFGTTGADSITDHATAQAQSFEASGIPLPTVSPDNYTITVPGVEEPIVTDDGGLVLEYVEEHGATAEPQVEGPSGDDYAEIQEDDPNWDCRFHGNQQCGVEIQGVWYIVQFEDGSPVSVGYRD